MSRNPRFVKWDDRFLAMARMVASWSKDPSTQVGAVIVDHNRRVIGTGYNGFPRGIADHSERLADKALKHEMVVHAEVNAIRNAARSVDHCTLYTTAFPCPRCASEIVQSGIKRIVSLRQPGYDERWADRIAISKAMFEEVNISYDTATES